MPKVGMEPVRRRQLITATIRTIHELGFQKVTLNRVAHRAGISPGLVAHYFSDKAGLLEATMRHIAEELSLELSARLAVVETPEERLQAILDANFSERSFAPEAVSAWVAFWGQAHGDPRLTRMQRVLRVRLKSNLAFALRELVSGDEAVRIATGLSVFIDGLSLRHCLGEEGLDRLRARAYAQDYLDKQLTHARNTRKKVMHNAESA